MLARAGEERYTDVVGGTKFHHGEVDIAEAFTDAGSLQPIDATNPLNIYKESEE